MRMTFGMRNMGNTFQRLMDRVLGGVGCAFPYLDNIFHLQQRGGGAQGTPHAGFAGSGSGIINFGSGSYELQFLVTKIALNLLRPHWLLKILL